MADAFINGALEDDRLALRCEDLAESVEEEVQWLLGLSDFTWGRLASLSGGRTGPNELKTDVLLAGLTMSAFIGGRVFRVARSYPWSLTTDTDQQLDDLGALDSPPEETIALNVWYMLRAGVSRARFLEAVALLGECQWSTRCVEQGHGSMACIRKQHL